jgi:hypothetical protein
MDRRWLFAGLLILSAGCNRQDAEGIGRIGNLVAHKLGDMKPTLTTDSGLDRALPALIPTQENDEAKSRK